MRYFTNNYPGANRITITGHPDDEFVKLKVFGDGSAKSESSTGKYLRRRVSTYPVFTDVIYKNDMSKDDFINSIESAAVRLAKKFKYLVVDGGSIWGFYQREQFPFDDEISF